MVRFFSCAFSFQAFGVVSERSMAVVFCFKWLQMAANWYKWLQMGIKDQLEQKLDCFHELRGDIYMTSHKYLSTIARHLISIFRVMHSHDKSLRKAHFDSSSKPKDIQNR